MEIWKDIKGYEGKYQVSNLGRIKSLNYRNTNTEHLMGYGDSNGYPIIGLSKNGCQKFFLVHRLVAEAFIPNVDNKPEVDHINRIKSDNRVENLRWVTEKENATNRSDSCLPRQKTPVAAIQLSTGKRLNFKSINDACRLLHLSSGHVSDACRAYKGHHRYNGYEWYYT